MSQQINLFNPVFLEPPKQFSLLTMLQGLALIFVGGMSFYGYAWYQLSTLDKQLVQSAQQLDAKRALLLNTTTAVTTQQSEQMLQDKVRELNGKLADADELVNNLRSGSVGNTSGYSEYLRAFSRQVVSGLWLTGFKIIGDATEISLSGGALSPDLVPAYIKKLGNEPVMQGKRFAAMEMKQVKSDQGKRYVEFTLHSLLEALPASDNLTSPEKRSPVAGEADFLEKMLDPDQGGKK